MEEQIDQIQEVGELCTNIQLANSFIRSGQLIYGYRHLRNLIKQIEQSGKEGLPAYADIVGRLRRAAAALLPAVSAFSETEGALGSAKAFQKVIIEEAKRNDKT